MSAPIVDRDPGDERGERREGERRKYDRGTIQQRRGRRKGPADRRTPTSTEGRTDG